MCTLETQILNYAIHEYGLLVLYVFSSIFETVFILLQERKTRAPRGTDRSPEYNDHFCYKLDSTERNEKQQNFIINASRSLLWIQFVAVAFRTEEEVFM